MEPFWGGSIRGFRILYCIERLCRKKLIFSTQFVNKNAGQTSDEAFWQGQQGKQNKTPTDGDSLLHPFKAHPILIPVGVIYKVWIFCETSIRQGYLCIPRKLCTTKKRSGQIISFSIYSNDYVLSTQQNQDKILFLPTSSSSFHAEKGVGLLFS